MKAVFKIFSIFPWTLCDYSFPLSSETYPNTPCHPLRTPLLLHFFSKSSRKDMGLLFLTSYFIFWILVSWFLSCYCILSHTVFVHFTLKLLGMVGCVWCWFHLLSYCWSHCANLCFVFWLLLGFILIWYMGLVFFFFLCFTLFVSVSVFECLRHWIAYLILLWFYIDITCVCASVLRILL